MARKHRKAGIIKQFVPRAVVAEAQTARKVVLNPETGLYEVVIRTVKPAIIEQGKAAGSTVKRGLPNTPPSKTGGKK